MQHDFDFMVKMARQARSKLARFKKHHKPEIQHADVSDIIFTILNDLRSEVKMTQIAIGNESERSMDAISKREQMVMGAVKGDLKRALEDAAMRLENFYYAVAEDTIPETTKWIERGRELRKSLNQKTEYLEDYYFSAAGIENKENFIFSFKPNLEATMRAAFMNGKQAESYEEAGYMATMCRIADYSEYYNYGFIYHAQD